MNKRIVFFDIDGTLIDNATNTIPQSCIDAIHKAQENGHVLIVNTGRPNVAVDTIIKKIGFDGYICGCGTYIEYKNEVIFHQTLENSVRKEILEQMYTCNMQGIVEGTEGVFFRDTGTHPFFIESYEYYEKQGFPIGFYHKGDLVPFDKMAVLFDENSDPETFKAFLRNDFDIIQRAETFIEVVPKPFSKATGIQYLLDHLGMSLDQAISIGDSTNDLPMLTYTPNSVAMGNANPILFDKVTYVTTDIDQDGIENALKHFELI